PEPAVDAAEREQAGGRARRIECEAPRHVVEPDLQLMAVVDPAEGLVDLPIVIDLFQTARAVAQAGHAGDIRGGPPRRGPAAVGIENTQLSRDRAEPRARIVNPLEHARVADVQVVIFRGPEGAAVTEHRLLARHHDLPRTPRAGADGRLR